mgnify:CR=1 FL=1
MNSYIILFIIAAYFTVLLLIAWITGRNNSNEAFFLGDRKSPWYIVSIGMVGTSLSGVTFVSVPGMVRAIDMTYMQTVLGFFVGIYHYSQGNCYRYTISCSLPPSTRIWMTGSGEGGTRQGPHSSCSRRS